MTIPPPDYQNSSPTPSGAICYAYNMYTGASGLTPGNAVKTGGWKNTELFLGNNCNIDVDAGGNALGATVALYGSCEENPAPTGGTQIGSNIVLTGNQMIPLTNGPYRWVRMDIVAYTQGAIQATLFCVAP
jgi:hypothetical protein